jgi:hypothetical protein
VPDHALRLKVCIGLKRRIAVGGIEPTADAPVFSDHQILSRAQAKLGLGQGRWRSGIPVWWILGALFEPFSRYARERQDTKRGWAGLGFMRWLMGPEEHGFGFLRRAQGIGWLQPVGRALSVFARRFGGGPIG